MSVEKVFKVEGMHCAMCKKHVEEALKSLDGVKKVKVDLESGNVKIKSKEEVSEDNITKVIDELGFKAVF